MLKYYRKYAQYITFIYEERENIDLDASLYQSGFFSDEEKDHCIAFHKISNDGKINLIDKNLIVICSIFLNKEHLGRINVNHFFYHNDITNFF